MKKLIYIAIPVIGIVASLFLFNKEITENTKETKKQPNEWFYSQRAFPFSDINYEAYKNSIDQAKKLKLKYTDRNKYFTWEFAGPINIGGRISAVALNPVDPSVFYVGAASGGVFKTTNAGVSWDAIFDDQPSLSIGDIAIAPSNPDVI
jgi:hypothetical protein